MKSLLDKGKDELEDDEDWDEGEKPRPIQELLKSVTPTVENPKKNAGFLYSLFFSWINPLFDLGSKRDLQPKDLYKMLEDKKIEIISEKFKKLRLMNPKKSISQLAFQMVKKEYIIATILFVVGSMAQMLAPTLFNYFNTYFKKLSKNPEEFELPLFFLTLIFLDLFVRQIMINKANDDISSVGSKIGVLLRHEIFQQILKMNIAHLETSIENQASSLLVLDIDNILGGLIIVPNFTAAALLITASFYYLYTFGPLSVFLVFLLFIAIGMLYKFHHRSMAARQKLLKCTDHVFKVMKELFENVESVKIGRFEKTFYRNLINFRVEESKQYKKYLLWNQLGNIVNNIFPPFFGLTFFLLNIMVNEGTISLEDTFIILTVISFIKTPLSLIAEGFDKYPEYTASKRRVESFLEKISLRTTATYQDIRREKGEISMQNCTFGLMIDYQNANGEIVSHKKKDFIFDISIYVPSGAKIAFVGPPGSGKTLVFMAILGETSLTSGIFSLRGKMVYLSRDCTFYEDSVYQNIVCGAADRKSTRLNSSH